MTKYYFLGFLTFFLGFGDGGNPAFVCGSAKAEEEVDSVGGGGSDDACGFDGYACFGGGALGADKAEEEDGADGIVGGDGFIPCGGFFRYYFSEVAYLGKDVAHGEIGRGGKVGGIEAE